MKIPFSLPVIDDEVIAEMHDTLTHTGWLTTGPKARALDCLLYTSDAADE